MDARSFTAEQALRMFEVDNRRTEVGRAVTKALADVNPRLADIAIHGGSLLPGEDLDRLMTEVVNILRPLTWARPEMVVAAVMKPFGGFYENLGLWALHRSPNRNYRPANDECQDRVAIREAVRAAWQALLNDVEEAWEACMPEGLA